MTSPLVKNSLREVTGMIAFDFFAATVEQPAEAVINFLTEQLDLTWSRPCKPRYGFLNGAIIVRGPRALATVYWGGKNGCAGTHVSAKGSGSSAIRSLLLRLASNSDAALKVTRVDACRDIVEVGLFDRVATVCADVAQSKGLKISQVGDWVRGESRTLYIGSRKSETMVRIYEKGYQAGGNTDWVRLELEFKPRTRARRIAASTLEAQEVFFMGIGSRIFTPLGLGSVDLPDLPSACRPSDISRSREALIWQYGRTLANWADEVGGYPALGKHLESMIIERRKGRPSA